MNKMKEGGGDGRLQGVKPFRNYIANDPKTQSSGNVRMKPKKNSRPRGNEKKGGSGSQNRKDY